MSEDLSSQDRKEFLEVCKEMGKEESAVIALLIRRFLTDRKISGQL